MKKKRKNQFFILYLLCILGVSALSMYSIYQLHHFSILTIILSVGLFSFLILFFLFLLTRDIKYQKTQWFLVIFLLISSLYGIQTKRPSKLTKEYNGIDISKWNGNVNLQNVVLEIDFVIIRCGYTSNTDGTTLKIDDQFKENIKQCKELGIPYGVYYYSLAITPALAKLEADYTLSLLDGDIPPLGVYIDVEDEQYQGNLSKDELTNIALTFVKTIENTEIDGGVYANYYWWNHKLDNNVLEPYLKWLAFYSEEYEMEEIYQIHQYSDAGQLSGSDGAFDVNVIKEKYW